MTLLSALNDAQRLLSLPVTANVVADGQETQNLLFALAKEEVAECASALNWPKLLRTHSFTASLASLQSGALPSDFDRIAEGSFWNRTEDREVCGPLSSQEYALAYGRPVTATYTQYWMRRYDGIHIFPVPASADTMAFEYVINTPVQATGGGAFKETFTADTDETVLGDRLLRLGVIWRYKQAKGRDYAEDMKNYEMAKASEFGKQRSARVLSLTPRSDDVLGMPLTPESGFGA